MKRLLLAASLLALGTCAFADSGDWVVRAQRWTAGTAGGTNICGFAYADANCTISWVDATVPTCGMNGDQLVARGAPRYDTQAEAQVQANNCKAKHPDSCTTNGSGVVVCSVKYFFAPYWATDDGDGR
jgi:hypothetical protein